MSARGDTIRPGESAPDFKPEEKRVIFASSLGTVFEWYDFYLYAVLAPFFAALFFPPGNQTAALLSAFAAYAAGFLVRPFGALLFGRIGDLVGRKYTFLITIVVMGASTFAVGLLPTYETLGWAAPILMVSLRLLQGLALGGEYGGAATYVAEHAPNHRRGYDTSWIQTTATLGLFLALLVIWLCRSNMDAKAFADWGWRVPFWVSIFLLGLLGLYPAQAGGVAGVPEDEVRGQGLEIAAHRQLPQSTRTTNTCCSRCSALLPARAWSGTRGSSTRCSSSSSRSSSTTSRPTP
jgi:MFS family permease